MKRLLLLLALCTGSIGMTQAQLADGSIAPDWTMSDINGNSHHLYNYLDQGYTVFLDFSATWCGPCWTYHLTGAFDDLFSNHGPAGMLNVLPGTTDDVMVFFIEGDNATTSADLNGTGSNTQGDWVSGVTHPIIDNAAQDANYGIAYWPTIYKICPNRIITEVGQVSATSLYNSVSSCASAVSGTNGAVLSYNGDIVTCDGSLNVSTTIQNMGTNTITTLSLELRDGATVLASQTYSGSLATYGIATVNFGTVSISASTTLSVVITTADANATDNTVTQAVTFAPNTQISVDVKLLTDDYPAETYWEVRSSSNVLIAWGGNELVAGNAGTGGTAPTDPTSPLVGNTLYTTTVTLPAIDCYTFTIYDYYGDGLGAAQWGGTDGSWTIKSNTGTTLNTFTGDFGDSDASPFKNQTVGIEEATEVSGLNIYPNPMNAFANIDFTLVESADVTITVLNTLGEVVCTEDLGTLNLGSHSNSFSVENLNNGLYFFYINVNKHSIIKRVAIAN